jgi:thiol-disulfide isomerase/thioredoxin
MSAVRKGFVLAVAFATAFVAETSLRGGAPAHAARPDIVATRAAMPQPVAGESFGSLVLKDLDGASVSLARLRGKVVVLNFWATWCKPCIEEMPLLADLATRYQNRGLVVVVASVDEETSRADVARVAAALPAGVEVWIGATPNDMQRLHLGDALPATAILNRRGELEHRQRGPLTPGLVDDKIESLLGEGGAPKAFPDAIQAALPRRAPLL